MKKINIIAIIVLVLLAGAAAYLYFIGGIPALQGIIGADKPVAETIQPEEALQKEDTAQEVPQVASDEKTTPPAKEDGTKEAPQDDGSFFIPEEGLRIFFSDGYQRVEEDRGVYVAFWPLSSENFGPDESQKIEPTHMYRMEFSEQRSWTEAIAVIKESYSYTAPTIEKIYGFTVVKWIDAGMCESGVFEIVGKKWNFFFKSMSGCTDPAKDFEYYTKTIRAMRYVD